MRPQARSTVAAVGIGLGVVTFAAFMASCSQSAQGAANNPQPVMASMQMSLTQNERGAKGIKGSLEDDEKVTQGYWLTLGWGDDLPDSAAWEGNFGEDDVRIRLVPASTSPLVTWSNALSSDPATYSGHLVMKIVVLEDRRVKELKLDGLETGYLWIGQRGKGNADSAGAAIYTIKNNGKVKLATKMDIVGFCKEDHGGRPMAYVRADDKCKEKLPPGGARSSSLFSSFKTRSGPAPLAVGQGLWVTCTGGCCEVKAQGT
ncbi:MAG TPA: hypothetical protein VF042_02705 [Gemmatimonadaceae bacterium]